MHEDLKARTLKCINATKNGGPVGQRFSKHLENLIEGIEKNEHSCASGQKDVCELEQQLRTRNEDIVKVEQEIAELENKLKIHRQDLQSGEESLVKIEETTGSMKNEVRLKLFWFEYVQITIRSVMIYHLVCSCRTRFHT